MKILFLGRSKDIFSKKIFLELKKKYKNTIFVKSRKIGDKLPKKFNKILILFIVLGIILF